MTLPEDLPSAVIASTSDSTDETELVEAVFGSGATDKSAAVAETGAKTSFYPWHHPVKQIVRDYQWAHLTEKLIAETGLIDQGVLRYFTLPGSDLLDVRVLADRLRRHDIEIDYFGFDIGYDGNGDVSTDAAGIYFAAESALRQAGKVANTAEVLRDRLEDIAQAGSHAESRLKQKRAFDIINIDACQHLGHKPPGRTTSIFDALERLLAHQLSAERPWLLFLTTRVSPDLLGDPALKLQGAIQDNLKVLPKDFAQALADVINGDVSTLATAMIESWSRPGHELLKIFTVGVGKYLLQFFHAQHNHPAKVELASAFSYPVYSDHDDMLSIAFRVTPRGLKVQPATAGTVSTTSDLELGPALQIAQHAAKLWQLNGALKAPDVREDAVLGTGRLLKSADYNLVAWREWLSGLEARPFVVTDQEMAQLI